jgi:HME family heavy-metal exporter
MFAEIAETDGPNQIQREGARRRIVVYGNGDGRRDMAAIAADIRRILADIKFPQGYTTSLEGSFQAQEEATLRIGALSLVSLSAIFLVLYSRYRSTVLALIIMGNIPLALIGSVIALNVAGQPLSVASMIGFITLAGISARNGILKISHLYQSCPARTRTFRASSCRQRQPGTADPGTDDCAFRWSCAYPPAVRRR